MKKTLYFISGLPRSGSTLLSALLNQNPRFYSGPSSPVVETMRRLSEYFNEEKLFKAYPKVNQIEQYITDCIKYYYAEVKQEVIFDKNRTWTASIEAIEYYYKIEPKIICMVRDISEIYASVKNTKLKIKDELLSSKDTLILEPYDKLKKAFYNNRKCLYLVEYNDLVNKPNETMIGIYNFLGEQYYQHTFNNIEQKYKENDLDVYGVNLHNVKQTISKSFTIPTQDIIDKCKDMEFWR